jgi:hypothetical protein
MFTLCKTGGITCGVSFYLTNYKVKGTHRNALVDTRNVTVCVALYIVTTKIYLLLVEKKQRTRP